MELTLVPLLLPAIQQQFGLSIGELAWVFNSYGIAVAIGVLLGGWLGDTFGTRTVFGIGVLLFASGSILVAAAGSYEMLIVGRILQGYGGGIFSPLIPVLLTTVAPERPGRILIVWGSIAGYVAAFAPLVYSTVLTAYNWNLAFVIFAIVSLAALVIERRSRIGTGKAARPRPDPGYARLLRSRELWLMFVYVFCTYGSITYYLFRLPVWLADGDFEVVSIGLILSILWLSFSVTSTFLRNSVDAPKIRLILLGAPILIAAGFLVAYQCQGIACLIVASLLLGSGLACSNAPSTQMVLEFAPDGMSALSASLDISFARLGGVVTVAVLADAVFGYTVIAIMSLSLVAVACAWVVGQRVGVDPWRYGTRQDPASSDF